MRFERMIQKYLEANKEKIKDLNKQTTRQLRIKKRKKRIEKVSEKYNGTEK
jgi:hypothetical protein